MPSCLIVQHLEPEGPWAIGDALAEAGVELSTCRVHRGDPVPKAVGDFDGLVVMGGPMSAASDDGFATRRDEMALLARALELGIPTLGVCLGAQLLAAAAGAPVMAGTDGLEVGWGPVELAAAAGDDPLFAGLPSELTVLHWHGDTFDLPPGGLRLASNARYREQAFRVGERAWGLQFHLEVDADAVAAFLSTFGDDALAAGTTPQEISNATATAVRELAPHRGQVLERFAALVAAGRPVGTSQLVDRA